MRRKKLSLWYSKITTDDEEISEIEKIYNIEVPFLSPKHLSDDFAGITMVVSHALKWLKLENRILKS